MSFHQLRLMAIGFFILLPSYFIFVFSSENFNNPINAIIYFFSGILFIWAFVSILERNINGVNVFSIFYFGSLFFNTFNLSDKQLYKEPIDMYYFMLAPLIFMYFIYIVEKVKIDIKVFNKFFKPDIDTLYLIFLITYILLKLYIGVKVGFRIMDYGDVTKIPSGDKYSIPGISGVSAVLQWTLLVLVPFVKKRYSIVAIMSIIVLSGILHVKRGDIMRVMLFLSIYSISKYLTKNKISIMFIFKCLFVLGFTLFVFSAFGQYRLEARGGDSSIILTYLGSRVDSIIIAWIYSYFSFNFEVLKLYFDIEPIYQISHVLSPFFSFIEPPKVGDVSISGFNAATFIAPLVLDMGVFYPIELVLYSIVISIFIFIFKKFRFSGALYFIYTMLALMVFGDYFYERSIMMSMLFFILLIPILDFRKERV
ncbi:MULTISPECIES: O-antigen polymerase [Vibrio harveyi group]|uniref:Polysaccharide polymerase n=6 Tax=Vibrio harveyi group TaxID=717610 RepID=A0A5P4S8T6_VIBPH|nr:O-antigen polymerase [Vibrio parahaemolyticus]QFC18282.1 polysaccharide polymerase [Vibrio parahaemolyticus]